MTHLISQVRDAAAAAIVLQRRGLVDVCRPLDAVSASRGLRRYGSFGGLVGHVAARYGDAPALTDEVGTLSFAELETLSNALAWGLADRGIVAGSVIGLLVRNHRALPLALFAAGKVGARVVLLNTGFAAPQLADVCKRENVTAVIADDEFTDLIDVLPFEVDRIVGWSGQRGLVVLAAGRSTAPLPAPASVGGMVLLTSGTTGTPKGAPRNKVSPLQSAQLLDRIPWPSRSVYYVAAPMFHATGLATCSLGFALGNQVVLARRFDPEATLAAIERHRVSALIVVPTMLTRMLDLGPEVLARYDTSSLTVVFAAGSALSPDLCRRTMDAFGDVLYNLYGSTEVAVAAVATPSELRSAPGTVGRPPVGCTLAAYDEQRRRITEPGRSGTLFVSSGLSFAGYTDGGNKESVDGLLSSGDTGHFDENGLWFVDGRDDDMIVSGGENVFPLEVENLLAGHPAVVETSVVGVDDVEFGKRLCAFVVRRPGADLEADEIKSYVRAELARHKVPRDIVFVDVLPRNETGKVLKAQLQKAVEQ
ncbi:acyl-CoA synthetase [Mycolicibacterium mucogenicum]|uniref:Long-chain-fatty-acid--CoA ligase FadD13 n=1 Tax=Mycolicibacterium mucogenicum DSM 44124 TaxID=1226753 RepID=A0A8H2JCB1_MYCMU|nr:acyl-CoA synthetase [Mycolicibacterium mucogenicum]KAB7758113.1 acyl-CoA synthetase [Mycolicibacterium mucogenicum DSM 44124]QPG71541.1 acyl-CoA synthetase [Mycolicibacterium mucogenicum DSM 44124]